MTTKAVDSCRISGMYPDGWRANSSPDFSVIKLLLIKVNIFAYYLAENFRFGFRSKRHKKKLRGLKDSGKEKCCLVVGNGPSVNSLNIDALREFHSSKHLDVIAINRFHKLPIFEDFEPDFLILSDPANHPNRNEPENLDIWNRAQLMSKTQTITPISWHGRKQGCRVPSNQCLHFNDFSLEGFTKNTNPEWPRGYPSNTAFKALAIANYLGYKQIFYIGIDHSSIDDFRVLSDGTIMIDSAHAVPGYVESRDMTNYYRNGVGDIYYDISETYLGMKRSFRWKHLVNLNQSSKTDFVSKIKDDDEYIKLLR